MNKIKKNAQDAQNTQDSQDEKDAHDILCCRYHSNVGIWFFTKIFFGHAQ